VKNNFNKEDKIRGRSIRVNLRWALLGTIYTAFSQWLLLVALARFGNSSAVGELSLGLAITAPMFMLLNLNLRTFAATDAIGDFSFSEYFGARCMTSVVAVIGTAVVAFGTIHNGQSQWVIFAVGFTKFFDALSDITYGCIQKYERMDWIASSQILRGTFSIICVVVLTLADQSLSEAILVWALAWALCFFFFDVKKLRNLELPLRIRVGRTTLRLIRRTFSLGVVMMLISLNHNIPLYFIKSLRGTEEVGYYAVMVYFLIFGQLIANAVGQTATPRFANYFVNDRWREASVLLIKLLSLMVMVGAAGVLGAWLIGREVLDFFYGSEYSSQVSVLIWIMVGASLSYVITILGGVLTAARRFREMVQVNVMTVGLTAIFCALLVSKFGLLGAAWSVCGAMVVKMSTNLILVRNVFRRISSVTV